MRRPIVLRTHFLCASGKDQSIPSLSFTKPTNETREPEPHQPCGWFYQPRILYTLNSFTKKLEHLQGSTIFPPKLFQASDGSALNEALVTSFDPWDPAFLIDHIPKSTRLTFVVEGTKKENVAVKKAEVWWCLDPSHTSWVDGKANCCVACKIPIPEGDKFIYCKSCCLNFCMDCHKKLLELPYPERRTLMRAAKIAGHEVHNCCVKEKTNEGRNAKTCHCIRKRKLSVIHPPLVDEQYSIQHAKLMLLKFEEHLRIVISSFNLDEDGQLESMSDSFWVQDFPLLDDPAQKPPRFINELSEFVDCLGSAEWAQRLSTLPVDYSQLDPNIFLIRTVPNKFNKRNIPSPLKKMRETLEGMELVERPHSIPFCPVLVQTFSLGGAGKDWLEKYATALGTKLSPSSLQSILSTASCTFDANGTIRKNAAVLKYPKELDASWHSKMITRWSKYQCTKCDKYHGWLYLGSHNLSKSSWEGHLWELGILWCSSPKTCEGQLDLAKVTLPYPLDALRPFSWKDSWPIISFNDVNATEACPGYAIVVSSKSHAIQICDVVVQIDGKSVKRSVELILAEHGLARLDIGTLLQVSCLIVNSSRVTLLFVERIFRVDEEKQKEEVDAPNQQAEPVAPNPAVARIYRNQRTVKPWEKEANWRTKKQAQNMTTQTSGKPITLIVQEFLQPQPSECYQLAGLLNAIANKSRWGREKRVQMSKLYPPATLEEALRESDMFEFIETSEKQTQIKLKQ